MTRASLIVVLAEDDRHQQFVRRYLYRLGYTPHDIRFDKIPSGARCGEQWVRQHYAKAVADYRNRVAKAETGLVVVIDSDTVEVSRRHQQLEVELAKAQFAARGPEEGVTHLVPKRNIETWILCLSGISVDEVSDYKAKANGDGNSVKAAAETFYEWSRPNATIPAHCVPSLRLAIPEVRRLDHRKS